MTHLKNWSFFHRTPYWWLHPGGILFATLAPSPSPRVHAISFSALPFRHHWHRLSCSWRCPHEERLTHSGRIPSNVSFVTFSSRKCSSKERPLSRLDVRNSSSSSRCLLLQSSSPPPSSRRRFRRVASRWQFHHQQFQHSSQGGRRGRRRPYDERLMGSILPFLLSSFLAY